MKNPILREAAECLQRKKNRCRFTNTLLVNAGAVLNFKYRSAEDNFSVEEGYRSFGNNNNFYFIRFIVQFSSGQSAMAFLVALRQLRIFIAIWNLFVIFLMFV
ncbi:Small integral membrane protein 7 [Trichinella sp. T8]|nr:Small integral membrane protein 7 [Trichinella sp. T8]